MGIDQKIRYALVAFALASTILTALGLHAGVHFRVFEIGGGTDHH